ncbi:helix-turn-helix domain-containing protein [Hafnia alvei]|uniref:helix-turn-helix domain-containing protein n=1 Tax=Hafnia alvei TaxID=569 RepID=UPI0024A97B2E|nr:helix-turn-helix domain-containing protein [Hafnia alvei]
MNSSNKNSLTLFLFNVDSYISMHSTEHIYIKANQQVIIGHKTKIQDTSTLDSTASIKIPIDTIYNYIKLTKYNTDSFILSRRMEKNLFYTDCVDIEVFNLAVKYANIPSPTNLEKSHLQALTFLLLSYFPNTNEFISFLLCNINTDTTFKVKEIISSDLSKKWSLGMVAKVLCLSSSTLKKHLQAEGSTYREILIESRMEHANNTLMANYHIIISELAPQCGYKNTSHFIHVFKRYFGVTPYQYIKNTTK